MEYGDPSTVTETAAAVRTPAVSVVSPVYVSATCPDRGPVAASQVARIATATRDPATAAIRGAPRRPLSAGRRAGWSGTQSGSGCQLRSCSAPAAVRRGTGGRVRAHISPTTGTTPGRPTFPRRTAYRRYRRLQLSMTLPWPASGRPLRADHGRFVHARRVAMPDTIMYRRPRPRRNNSRKQRSGGS